MRGSRPQPHIRARHPRWDALQHGKRVKGNIYFDILDSALKVIDKQNYDKDEKRRSSIL